MTCAKVSRLTDPASTSEKKAVGLAAFLTLVNNDDKCQAGFAAWSDQAGRFRSAP